MDLRSLCLLISGLALASGILLGWTDHRAEREALSQATETEDPRAADPSAVPRPPERRRRGSGIDRDRLRAGRGSSATPVAADRHTDAADGVEKGSAAEEISAADQGLLDEIEEQIARQSFVDAADEARALSETLSGAARRRARQLEAKATVFHDLIPEDAVLAAPQDGRPRASENTSSTPEPARTAPTAPPAFEIELANRNVFQASAAEEELDVWRVTLLNGKSVELPREDVIEVRPIEPGTASEPPAPQPVDPPPVDVADDPGPAVDDDLLERLAAIDNPIDLYLRGVRKLYQTGRSAEGLQVLERILAMPDGEQVPLVFGGEGSDDLLANWRIARGEDAGALLSAADGSRSGTGHRDEAGLADPTPRRPSGPVTREDLIRWTDAIRTAQGLYREARGRDDGDGDLTRAYEQLLAIQKELHALEQTDDVRALQRQLGIVLHDVIKSLPF